MYRTRLDRIPRRHGPGLRAAGVLAGVAAGVLVATVGVSTHHSIAVIFDAGAPVRLTGRISTVRWTNPHVQFSIDVSRPDGPPANWTFEMASINVMRQRGWGRTTLAPGDTVTVEGFRAIDRTRFASVVRVTWPDGRTLVADGSDQRATAP